MALHAALLASLLLLPLLQQGAAQTITNFTSLGSCDLTAPGGSAPACSLAPAQATMTLLPQQAATIPFGNLTLPRSAWPAGLACLPLLLLVQDHALPGQVVPLSGAC